MATKSKFTKYSIPKHQRDRLLIAEQKRILRNLIKESLLLRDYIELECKQPEDKIPLGNACYWKRQLKAPY